MILDDGGEDLSAFFATDVKKHQKQLNLTSDSESATKLIWKDKISSVDSEYSSRATSSSSGFSGGVGVGRLQSL